MKKNYFRILNIIVLLLLPLVLLAQKPRQNMQFEIGVKSYPKVISKDGIDLRENDNLPAGIYDINLEVTGGNPSEKAANYLRQNWELFGLTQSFEQSLSEPVIREGLSGTVVRFRQEFMGLEVDKNEFTIKINNEGKIVNVLNTTRPIDLSLNVSPSRSVDQAYTTVNNHLQLSSQEKSHLEQNLMIHFQNDTAFLVYRIDIITNELPGEWEAFVDANTNQIIDLHNIALHVNGTGNIFNPDPLSSSGSTYGTGGFEDNSDATNSDLDGQLSSVTLLDITQSGNTFSLTGPFASIVDHEAPFNGDFSQNSSDFSFDRNDDAFEAVMCYYFVDESMRYINNTLGISLTPFQYTGGVQIDPHGLNGADNSHYTQGSGRIAMGEGGVDDAEDADVIIHELGHGIHHWITNGGLSQNEGLSEGSGDYWGQSYSWSLGQGNSHDFFSWDGHNEFWPGRTTNHDVSYPPSGSIHTQGQLWATVLMKIYADIGRQKTDVIFLEGLAMTNSSTNQKQAAEAVYQAAVDLNYSNADLCVIYEHLDSKYTLIASEPTCVGCEISAEILLEKGDCSEETNLYVDIQGGTAPYTYEWSSGEITASVSDLSQGNYTVTITDAEGCEVTTEAYYVWPIYTFNTWIFQDTTITTDTQIAGDLIVQGGVQLTVSAKLEFQKGKRLVVRRGAKLVVDGGHLTKCPDSDDWRGIVVEGNSNLPQPALNSMPSGAEGGIVHVKNNSLIEWARTAISTNYYGAWTNQRWGGLVHCENSEFTNNNRVAEFMKYDFVNNSQFINCTMDGASSINGTTVGVTIWDTDGVTFNRCRFYNMEGEGIVSYDAGTIVQGGNDFHHNRRGISNRATYPFAANLEVGSENSDPNYFLDNWFHIESYASNKLAGLKIVNNEFFDANSSMWIVGPSKYSIDRNSLAESTGGIVSFYTGSLNNNQHNYVRFNAFNTSSGVTAIGRNRELQVLCNSFNNNWDIRVVENNSGTQPGEIRLHQGNGLNPAGNCFTNPVAQGDINTIGTTIPFVYHHTNFEICETPVTPGNYTTMLSNNEACTDKGLFIEAPTREDLIRVITEIEHTQNVHSEDYYALIKLKEDIILYLLENALSTGNSEEALNILSDDRTTFSELTQFGIFMNTGDYESATLILEGLSNEIPEMQDFKQIQRINIERLRGGEEYRLSENDDSYLQEISESDMGVKAYARSILGLLTGKEYLDEFRLEERDRVSSSLDTDSQGLFTVAPNPVADNFTITIDEEYQDTQLRVTIYDVYGRMIYEEKIINQTTLDVVASKWVSGAYFVKIQDDSKSVEFASILIKK